MSELSNKNSNNILYRTVDEQTHGCMFEKEMTTYAVESHQLKVLTYTRNEIPRVTILIIW